MRVESPTDPDPHSGEKQRADLQAFSKLPPWLRRSWFWIMVLAFLGGVGIIQWEFSSLSDKLMRSKTLYDASLYSDALSEFRRLYSSEVVETVRQYGIEVTHDYKNRPQSIPLPATLSLLLGQRIGDHKTGAAARLYSPYPFPWRQKEGGLRDDFEEVAWESLNRNSGEAFYRFEPVNGRMTLRYAVADVMQQSCVNCHNFRADSPKRDWKVGDVRGILEVDLPMNRVETDTRAGLRRTLLLMLGLTAVGVLVIGVVIRRLQKTGEELRTHVVKLEESQTQILKANDDIRAARDEAVTANQVRGQFLANMSHELRTPLNAIIGYSEILRDEAVASGSELSRDAEKIGGSARHLLGLIDDILELTRFETGRMEMRIAEIDLASFAHEVGEEFRATAEINGNRLTIQAPPDAGRMWTDSRLVKRCLANLLSNAGKFTQGGQITLQVGRNPGAQGAPVEFLISDTGIGMDPAQADLLFEPFAQADPSSTRRHDGAGLGLAVTAKLTQLLNGSFSLRSRPGSGTTVTLRFPVRIPQNRAAAA